MPDISNYKPYPPNAEGFTEVLIDLKSTMASSTLYGVTGFLATAFEAVSQGQALYARGSDGLVGLAVANGTLDQANVVGFAQTSKSPGELVRVLTVGSLASSGLDAGDIYYLSAGTPGSITTTPPATPGHYVTRVGEANTAASLIVQLEPPILLR
jgi:hypothetical protein